MLAHLQERKALKRRVHGALGYAYLQSAPAPTGNEEAVRARADEWLSDLGTDDTRRLLTFANYISEQAHLAGHTVSWIRFLPWSMHAWRWGHLLSDPPPDPVPPVLDPDPPDLPDAALDEAHSAFVATLPAVSVSDAMHAEVDAARASFASSVSDATNAAAQAVFADFEYTATPAFGAGSPCFYSWSVVPDRKSVV